uniref:Uncharacterized protein n=1 Tax=Tanacetum cinerariifolium TaxID=118510 RepID=A0A6L2LBX1_TANCI|nr:hypothetical protein [Tanacetum cinerariifolium]
MIHKYDNKELTIHPTQVFSVLNWALKPNQPKGPPFIDHIKAICNIDVPVDFQALKTSLQTKKVPQGKKPGAKSRLRRKQSLKHTFESKTETSKSKTGQSDKETQSSLAKDKSPSHPSSSTLVVGEMHKEAQQAAGDPTSLGATSKEEVHPQLSSGTNLSVLIDKTKSARDGLKNAHIDLGTNEESKSNEILKKIKLEDLSDLIKDTRSAFFTPDTPQDGHIIVLDESEEVETKKDKETHATSHDVHLLQSQKDKLEQQKAKSEAKVTSLKGMKIKIPEDLNNIPTKLETFTSIVSSLMSQVVELKILKWELPAKFLALPSQILLVQAKLQTLDTLPCLLNKVANTLARRRLLGSVPETFSLSKIRKYLYFSLCSGSETKEGLCKELQFSLVDNSKLNVVYLLNRRLKHIVSLLEVIRWLFEEIHVTWAQLEKKRTRPRLYTNYLEENLTNHGDGIANHKRRSKDHSRDGVKDFQTASECSRLKETLEDSMGRRRDKNLVRTLGDYSKPSHGGYQNTIEPPKGNNVVPLRSDTIQLDARFSKFEANFKQQQGEMTNKIDTVLKAIIDRITGALPRDTVKNPKLNVNITFLVLSICSYPMEYLNAQPLSMVRSNPSQYVIRNQTNPVMTSQKKNGEKKRATPKTSTPP